MNDKWEIVTPGPPPPLRYDGRPGEETIGAKRPSHPKSANRRGEVKKTRWQTTSRVIRLVPWGALLATSVLLTGMVMFLVRAKDAADKSLYVFNLVQGSSQASYYGRLSLFRKSYGLTAGLTGGAICAVAFFAIVHIKQKLAREATSKGHLSRLWQNVLTLLGIIALATIILPSLWFMLNVMFISAWSMGLWTLREAATVASINMAQTNASALDLTATVMVTNAICPSIGCFNMNYYIWLDSSACLCTQQLIVDLQTAAKDAFFAVVWTLGAVACICFGSLLAGLQAGADMAVLTSEWHWGRLLAKAQSNANRSPTKPEKLFYGAAMPTAINFASAGKNQHYMRSPFGGVSME